MENNQPVDPSFAGVQVDTSLVQRLENLSGLFRSQDTVPTVPARKLDEQIRIVGSVPYLYDTESGTWISLGSTSVTYPGRVNADGSASTPFPSGWSVAKTSAGHYTITHNLANSGYVVQLQVISSLAITIVNLASIGANSFDVAIYNHVSGDTWSATDTAFAFVLVRG